MFLAFKKWITDRISHAMREHSSTVCKWHPCLPKGPTNSAHVRTIMTAALQQQYLQTELFCGYALHYTPRKRASLWNSKRMSSSKQQNR
jgi:hypothetical protein